MVSGQKKQMEERREGGREQKGRRRAIENPKSKIQNRMVRLLLLLMALTILCLLPLLLGWQRSNEERTFSLSNLRRLCDDLHLYAQDYDDRLMPPAQRLPDGSWFTWPQKLSGYGATADILNNPANSIEAVGRTVTDPMHAYAIHTSYALNSRFYGAFAPGPFLLDNLELPSQTVLLIEAGPMWAVTGRSAHAAPSPQPLARLDYGDTLDRVAGLVPYPSTHTGKIALAAADGHAVTVRVEHYSRADGPHDRLYGRIGGDIYNWNGGHPNGELDRPPHE